LPNATPGNDEGKLTISYSDSSFLNPEKSNLFWQKTQSLRTPLFSGQAALKCAKKISDVREKISRSVADNTYCSSIQDNPESQRLWIEICIKKGEPFLPSRSFGRKLRRGIPLLEAYLRPSPG